MLQRVPNNALVCGSFGCADYSPAMHFAESVGLVGAVLLVCRATCHPPSLSLSVPPLPLHS